jgi:hypothetical protein
MPTEQPPRDFLEMFNFDQTLVVLELENHNFGCVLRAGQRVKSALRRAKLRARSPHQSK